MPVKKIRDFYQKNQRWVPIVFFLLGFIFDTFMLKRIDELKVILQQAVYLIVAAGLIGVELIEHTREFTLSGRINVVWKYREALLHFLLGTLLNCYTIFYFKSASALTSFAFIGVLVVLLILNEFKRFGKSQTQVHMALLSLCLTSYFVALAPIIFGTIGFLTFMSSIVTALLVFWLYYTWLRRHLKDHPRLLNTHVVAPFGSIPALFVLLYLGHMIPPVPLSVTFMGIYHDVQKVPDGYELSYTRSPYKFWQHGDQTFLARPGDSIYSFVQVFSPSRFKDQLQIRWLYRDEHRGWQPSDAIPLSVVGGREEGYRGVTKKSNFTPGDWRVQVETRDSQEIGWIGFTVVADTETDAREMTKIIR